MNEQQAMLYILEMNYRRPKKERWEAQMGGGAGPARLLFICGIGWLVRVMVLVVWKV